ncbi:TRAP transporter small permease [Mameliella sediminis]|uniref:TRAP transporter small permease n=1 Tax=Mameliella sediminis TaxID=2836866 RepID=UPI001C471851|nr:TRAP transporter small permease [Mameliella sediminis]MBV7396976.1 TRAP transporter small permease [Mameliella sediminis]MBY6161735.1 TRAP transporter small permease [Mameliella alba]MBY6170205.1 TRAP transporter small permease [Mameliella alba]MBY6175224.1 TRAP transporter small permease [Mameliella alba]
MAGLHRIVLGLARFMALLGGVVLTALILITCISIIGRSVNTALHWDLTTAIMPGLADWLINVAGVGAIRGSYELVEAGMAFCIFAFLPYCQVTMGHASVDVFTNALPRPVNKVLDVLIAVLFAVALVTIAIQLNEGMLRKLKSGQTSLLLEFPIWWAYAASLFGAVLAAVASVYVALVRAFELLTGRVIVPNAVGADH